MYFIAFDYFLPHETTLDLKMAKNSEEELGFQMRTRNSIIAGFKVNRCKINKSCYVLTQLDLWDHMRTQPRVNTQTTQNIWKTLSANLDRWTYLYQYTLYTVISPNRDWSFKMEWTHNHASMHSSQVSGKKYTNMKIQFRQ